MKFRPGRSWKRLLLAVGIVGVIAVAVFLFRESRVTAEEFTTARIERGTIRNIVNATGTLQAVTTVQVGSQVSGTISALYADFNSVVRKGQVIAQLDPSLLQAQVASARANLEQARASLADAQARVQVAESAVKTQRAGVSGATANLTALKAQRDDAQALLQRQESLAASGLVTQRDLESARTNFMAADARYNQAAAQLDQARVGEESAASAGLAQARAQVQQAKAQVQQAQAALQLAEVNLKHTTISSPIDGIVVSRDVNVGQTVAASLSAPTLFTIANDLTQMQVIANIDQADIGAINSSNRISFTVDAFTGQKFDGTIRQIRLNPQTVQNVVTYNVVIDVKNPDLKLKPGMTANLTFTVSEKDDVLKVPNAALRFVPQGMTQEQIREMLRSARSQAGEQKNQTADAGANRRGARADSAGVPGLPEAQRRIVWVPGPDNKPQPRRIRIGITDGTATEIVEGELKEGDLVITGQSGNVQSQQSGSQRPPGFGNAPRIPGGGRGR